MTADRERWGLFEAPEAPEPQPRLRIDAQWTPWRLSRAIIRASLAWVLPGTVLLMVHNAALMVLPVVIGRIVDRVVTPLAGATEFATVATTTLLWFGALVGLYAVIHLSFRFGGRLGWFGVQRTQYELSEAVLARTLDERGMLGGRPPGALLAIATGDVHRACLVLYILVYPPGQLVGLLVAAVVLLLVHPLLGIGTIVALPVLLLLMHLVVRPLRRRAMTEQAGLANAAAVAADFVAGYRVLRGLHAQQTAADRYRTTSRAALQGTLAARSAQAGFEGVSTGTARLFAAIVVVAAAVLAFRGAITVGELVTVAGVAVSLVGPLDALVGTLGVRWAVSQASAGRVLDLLATEPEPAGLGTREPSSGNLVFDNVEIPGTDASLDLRMAPGEFVVWDVPQSAHDGLYELLTSKRRPEQGSITLDGVTLHEHRPRPLREHLMVAPHQPGVLAGAVMDNVRATGDQPGPVDAAREALGIAALHEAELPDGYDTAVGDGGHELSGGQRQRIALARAVAADPEILVLIEPTTSVDAMTEQRIAAALRHHRQGRTTIVCTGSPAFVAVADRTLRPERVNA